MRAKIRKLNEDLLGSRIVSTDGPAGLAVDIGNWLRGRQVLLPFEKIESFEEEGRDLFVVVNTVRWLFHRQLSAKNSPVG